MAAAAAFCGSNRPTGSMGCCATACEVPLDQMIASRDRLQSLSKDPVGFTEGGPGYFNRYWYTMGDPVNGVDPDGRQCCTLPEGRTYQENVRNMEAAGASRDATAAKREAVTDAVKEGNDKLGAMALVASPGPEDLVIGAIATGIALGIAVKAMNAVDGVGSAADGLKLQKQLVSESQMGQLAEGGGTVLSQPAKQADRTSSQYGVDAQNVRKVSSDAFTAKDGTHIETHAFRDASTNEIVEPKTIIDP